MQNTMCYDCLLGYILLIIDIIQAFKKSIVGLIKDEFWNAFM